MKNTPKGFTIHVLLEHIYLSIYIYIYILSITSLFLIFIIYFFGKNEDLQFHGIPIILL
jgi:hypothetical protein